MKGQRKPSHDLSQLRVFWSLLAGLKKEPRRGWKAKLRMRHPESVADHSYAVAVVCLFVAWSRGGYDQTRLLKLALLHDLDEALTGDLTPEAKRRLGRKSVLAKKRAAFKRVLSYVPENAKREYRGLWTDLQRTRSKEARLVKDVDLLEMAFQAQQYLIEGSGRHKVDEFYNSAVDRMKDPELRFVAERIALTSGKT